LGLAIKYGFDFLAPKVHQYIEWDSTVFYMLVPSHHKSCVYATVVEIMLHGEPIRKKTTRGGWEWFYRVPTSKLRVIDFER
jgi:hypothetical protein